MASYYDHDVGTDRIQNPSEIDIEDIQCTICSNVLWKPVACQSCETPFCSTCISRWIEKNPNVCPMKCDGYKERACPRFVIKQLAKAQFFCIHRSNGCNQVNYLHTHAQKFTFLVLKRIHRLFRMKH